MEFVIVTGFSGGGKSCCIDAMEDIGFYCIDNMPPVLITKFASLLQSSHEKYNKIAIVTDVRGGNNFDAVFESVKNIKLAGYDCKIVFIDTQPAVLARRYKETRRRHPLLSECKTIYAAINYEADLLRPLKNKADYLIDTTFISPAQLKQRIVDLFLEDKHEGLQINCVSFGFKYGLPNEADLVFDVRCLPNPYYVSELKEKTGLDSSVSDYVMKHEESQEYLKKILDMIDYLVPLFCKEGKSQLVAAFGCTGGKHRSVTFAKKVYSHLLESGYHPTFQHRDILK